MQNPLRREVAQLRRRDNDLAGQLRAREQQVDQLTATLRELQLVTQRQIGLYKRQLHLKDNSLQALQEELMDGNPQATHRSQQVVPGASTPEASRVPANSAAIQAASAVLTTAGIPIIGIDNVGPSSAGNPPRSSRRHLVQVPSAGGGGSLTTSAYQPGGSAGGLHHSASERRTGASTTTSHRSGNTPRPSDNERGRGSHAPPAPGKKDPRDRSLGALPHSPRPKPRDIGALPQSGGGEAPSSRRRTMPPVAARSTSAEERSRASWRRGEAHAASQKALRGAPARETGLPQTARQRR